MKPHCAAGLSLLLATPILAAGSDAPEYVIHVSVDGMGAVYLQELMESDMQGELATFTRLVNEGVYTFNARIDYGHSRTIPNHACMLTGRPTYQPEGQPATVHHGYDYNQIPGLGETLHNMGNPYVPYVASVFDVVHDSSLSTAVYASKDKFVLFDQSYDATSGAADVTGNDDGHDKIDRFTITHDGGMPLSLPTAAPMQAALIADLLADPTHYTFVHYRDPDSAGHNFGWGSAQYDNALRSVDGYLEELLETVESHPLLAGRTTIVVSSDHGGAGQGHDDVDDPLVYTIPFFVWGAGVRSGSELYGLNPHTRLDPESDRPDYGAPLQPVRNGDGGNLALDLLGLPAIPDSFINAKQDLHVGLPGTIAMLGCGTNPENSLLVVEGEARIGSGLLFGVDNPLGTQTPDVSFPILAVSLAPQLGNGPCGPALAGWGMAGSGAAGELLISLAAGDLIVPIVVGQAWGGPGQHAPVSIEIPDEPGLIGGTIYVQGAMIDPAAGLTGVPVGLAGAVEIVIAG